MAPHPWDTASCPSRFWLLWLWPVLRRGARGPLTEADLYDLPRHLQADCIDGQQRRSLVRSRGRGKTTVARVLLRAFGWRYPFVVLIFSVWLASLMMTPVLTDKLLACLASGEDFGVGLLLAIGLVAAYLVNCNMGSQWYIQTTQLGYEYRAAAALLVFRRILRLRMQDNAKDYALNLVQVDAERLYIFAQLSHLPLVAVIVVFAAAVYLLHYEGADVAGIALGIVCSTVALQAIVSRLSGPLRRRMQQASDERVALLAQALESFRVLKMYGWVPVIFVRLQELRRKELWYAAGYLIFRAFSSASSYTTTMVTMVAILVALVARGEQLSAQRVFLIYTIVGLVRAPLGGLAIGASAIVDGLAALRRLEAFIVHDGEADVFDGDGILDATGAAIGETPAAAAAAAVAVAAALHGSFVHGLDTESGFRVSLSIALRRGELVAVAGRVAAGKSSVLLALLGELTTSAGAERSVCSRVAYLAQPPWIRSGTVRQAVVQDLEFIEDQYWRAVRVAQLLPDLEAWAEGDTSFVGGRGLTLSGGQRARLGLAHVLYRCLVSHVELVLLDDCLSAVDVHVALAIVEEALYGLLLDGRRTVVMVMNSNFVALDAVDKVLAVQDGDVRCHGSTDEWLSSAPAELRHSVQQTTLVKPCKRVVEHVQAPPPREVLALALPKGQLCVRRSALATKVLAYYLGAGKVYTGVFVGLALAVPMLGAEALRVYSDYFMGQWAQDNATASESSSNAGFRSFLFWCLAAVLAAFVRVFVFVGVAVRTSHRVHSRLLDRLTAVPAGYFDVTPVGGILNHFSKDLDALDSLLPQYILDFAQDIVMLFGVVCVIVWSAPPAAIAVIPVLAGFYFIRTFFSRTSREARRLDSAGRGLLYSAVGDAADGLPTIRAHGQSAGLVAQFAMLLDRNGKAFFQNYILQPWCILVLDSLGAAIVFATAVSCIILRDTIPASAASMAIVYSLTTRGKLQFCIRLSVEAENQLVAVERLMHLEEGLPCESEEEAAAPSGWPSRGALQLRGVALRYRPELPLALRGLSLDVEAGTKVGLVGRTGSGKSSLLSAILRLVELESGSIRLDGVDICSVPRKSLRRAISVIPQDPVLWSGSLAFNLDPEGEADAAAALAALQAVGLARELEELGGLQGEIEARGSNLSLGQRQLLCVARGVLQRRPVVLLDEATSSMDGLTDARIQTTFRKHFRGRTLLVVAHRLATILDADKVVVLDQGVVVEEGPPATLRADGTSRFAKLAGHTSDSIGKTQKPSPEVLVDALDLGNAADTSDNSFSL